MTVQRAPTGPRRKLECGLRVLEGEHEGLTSHWRFEIAVVAPDHIELSEGRFLRGRAPLVVRVTRVFAAQVRPMGWAMEMSVNPGSPVFRLETETALLECVIVQPADSLWAVALLTGR